MKQQEELFRNYLPSTGVISYTSDTLSNRYYRVTDNGIIQICEIEKVARSYRVGYEIIPLTARTYASGRYVNGCWEDYGLCGGRILDASMEYFALNAPRWDMLQYVDFSYIPTNRIMKSVAIEKIKTLLSFVAQEFSQCESIEKLYEDSLLIDEKIRKHRIRSQKPVCGPQLTYSHIGGICGTACVLTHMGKLQEAMEYLCFARQNPHEKETLIWENAIISPNRDFELEKLYSENYACNLTHFQTIGVTLPTDWQQIVRLP